ncbi:flagellar biosynthetic protein FliR [Marinospirillum alkaliphilum]|uniref:Flagellar biosynthetic protein FliR n=1 Tax=Marinospirillum alkaliphilum DSM 21637 TaxID=1122209 RepID=A0A1K1VCD2_9GAMM|nr:flagellar biosynthetic protein FliR [Marinospirillum alkaliphilum]SFX22412.1 flagellar biosynthetic protein FliR [Marinospirillum alkaliphilum DSM 21637]
MLELTDAELTAWVGSFLWPFFRIGAFFMAAPIFGANMVPAPVRIGLSFFLTLMILPLLPPVPVMDGLSPQTWLLVAQQIIIGISLGFMVQLLFQVFVVFGQIVAMQIGMGMAQMADPSSGINVTVLSQYTLIMTNLVFLAAGGHLVIIYTLAESFTIIPVGLEGLNRERAWLIAAQGGWLFAGALLMALPIIIAKLVVNIALGVVTRAAPQLNIFVIGFPVMMMLGLLELWVWTTEYLFHFDRMSRDVFDLLRVWLELG